VRPVPRLYDQAAAEENALKTRSSSFFLLLPALLMTLSAPVHADKEVYRWVDDQGVVHFSDRPIDPRARPTGMYFESTDPGEVQQRLMREEYEQNEQEFTDTQQAESAAEEATRRAEEARTRDLQCNAARERFNVYTTAPRLYETLPGGERRYLTDDELTAAREQAEADVEKWCN
jgi:hypothetical protein